MQWPNFKVILGQGPLEGDRPAPLSKSELEEMRQLLDNECAQNDLTYSEAWGRIGAKVNLADRQKVEEMPAREPVVFHYYPDDIGPRYITRELMTLAEEIVQNDFAVGRGLTEPSLAALAAYIEKKSGAKRVPFVHGLRRQYTGILTTKPPLDVECLAEAVRTLGRHMFHSDSKEFDLSFNFDEEPDRGPNAAFLIGGFTGNTEEEYAALRAKRHLRYNRRPEDDQVPF